MADFKPLDFLSELERVPWFENLGQSVGPTYAVQQIHSWEEWPGPEEDDSLLKLNEELEVLHDEIVAGAGEQLPALKRLWDAIHAAVFKIATTKVPYDPQEDSWHGPSLSVWHAAWVAGLVGWCRYLGRPIPYAIQEQWRWFLAGHWPCGCTAELPDGKFINY